MLLLICFAVKHKSPARISKKFIWQDILILNTYKIVIL